MLYPGDLVRVAGKNGTIETSVGYSEYIVKTTQGRIVVDESRIIRVDKLDELENPQGNSVKDTDMESDSQNDTSEDE